MAKRKETNQIDGISENHLPDVYSQNSNKIRFDRFLASNITAFAQFGNDGHLMLLVSLYIAKTYQSTDLFGYGTFDVTEFSEQFGIEKNNLFREHPDPMYRRKEKKGKIKFYNTYIGNALYRLQTEALLLTKARKNIGNIENFETNSFQMLSYLKVYYDEDKRNKTIINYKADGGFLVAINRAFTLTNYKIVSSLRKPALDYLYVWMCQLRDRIINQGQNSITVEFDEMCKIAEIHIEEIKDRKKKLKIKLDRLIKEADFNFSYKFIKVSGRYNYGIELNFIDNKEKQKESLKAYLQAFENHYKRMLMDWFVKNKINSESKISVSEQEFLQWAKKNQNDTEIKVKLFIDSWNLYFDTKIDKFHHEVSKRFYRCEENPDFI
ncbi:MAG: hypothetical protein ACK4K9_10180 [Bacteroidia bacterium]